MSKYWAHPWCSEHPDRWFWNQVFIFYGGIGWVERLGRNNKTTLSYVGRGSTNNTILFLSISQRNILWILIIYWLQIEKLY